MTYVAFVRTDNQAASFGLFFGHCCWWWQLSMVVVELLSQKLQGLGFRIFFGVGTLIITCGGSTISEFLLHFSSLSHVSPSHSPNEPKCSFVILKIAIQLSISSQFSRWQVLCFFISILISNRLFCIDSPTIRFCKIIRRSSWLARGLGGYVQPIDLSKCCVL